MIAGGNRTVYLLFPFDQGFWDVWKGFGRLRVEDKCAGEFWMTALPSVLRQDNLKLRIEFDFDIRTRQVFFIPVFLSFLVTNIRCKSSSGHLSSHKSPKGSCSGLRRYVYSRGRAKE